jgi:CHAD domain-containing protein
MDVLLDFASSLSEQRDGECRVQLLEYLGHRRVQGARKLHRVVVRRRRAATRSLKRCASTIKRNFERERSRMQWSADAAAAALELSGELANWPKLHAGNLHPFRLKVKELRNVLRLSGEQGGLIDELGEVKNKIGEWHDWTELAKIAEDVLQHANGCEVMAEIRARTRQLFQGTVTSASHLRQKYFEQPRATTTRTREPRRVAQPVLKATASLAA